MVGVGDFEALVEDFFDIFTLFFKDIFTLCLVGILLNIFLGFW